MRIIAEVLGMLVFLGLVGLGIGWIIDNVEVRKAGGKLWSSVSSSIRGKHSEVPQQKKNPQP